MSGAAAERKLEELLAAGEREALRGRPGEALAPLRAAVAEATEQGALPEGLAAGWLLGVALGACGRFGEALEILDPLIATLGAGVASVPGPALFGALGAATAASVHRQLGRHLEARSLDDTGWTAVGPLGAAGEEARVDCAIGLAADAVGLAEAEAAHRWAEEAAGILAGRAEPGWRSQVRLDWVRSEIAMLEEQPADAESAAARALGVAERARAPRHVAKSLLFRGVAQAGGEDPAARDTLRRAASLADGIGALPLVWPARALLGALLGDAGRGELAAAGRAVREIAGGLPEALRAGWLARDDIAALLAAAS